MRSMNSCCRTYEGTVELTYYDAEIPPSETREEMRTFARGEFERNKYVHDLVSITILLKLVDAGLLINGRATSGS